jgi:hypothetical protein
MAPLNEAKKKSSIAVPISTVQCSCDSFTMLHEPLHVMHNPHPSLTSTTNEWLIILLGNFARRYYSMLIFGGEHYSNFSLLIIDSPQMWVFALGHHNYFHIGRKHMRWRMANVLPSPTRWHDPPCTVLMRQPSLHQQIEEEHWSLSHVAPHALAKGEWGWSSSKLGWVHLGSGGVMDLLNGRLSWSRFMENH